MNNLVMIPQNFPDPYCGSSVYGGITKKSSLSLVEIHEAGRIDPSLIFLSLSFPKAAEKYNYNDDFILYQNFEILDNSAINEMANFQINSAEGLPKNMGKVEYIDSVKKNIDELSIRYKENINLDNFNDENYAPFIELITKDGNNGGIFVMQDMRKFIPDCPWKFLPHWIQVINFNGNHLTIFNPLNSQRKAEKLSLEELTKSIASLAHAGFSPMFVGLK